ncbi:MAG: glycoside hydrolase family 99-like domain-containing protein [Filimonas sp.]|nr:glycoside hydrolase family 99-like domain-containing protein [Filimonas sp.]
MKNIKFSFIALCMAAAFASCKRGDNGPSVDDNILNYQIPDVPVTQDYVVGAFYYNTGSTFNANITEVPVVGKYTMPNGVVPPAVMSKHIEYAGKAGLDYFTFMYRSPNRDVNNFKSDSAVIKSFKDANTTANMKYALAYNFNPGTFGITTTSPLENDATKLEQFMQDVIRMVPYFKEANYMKVNGKALFYLMNAFNLYSNNNPQIYATLRTRLSALGVELYIVGMQERWSPPARYPFRFQNCVDAIYHQTYSQVNDWDRWYLLPQTMDQNWKYSKQWFADNIKVDYVPNISPAYSWKILSPTSVNPEYPRTDNGAMYKKLCNVAKLNASSTTRLILIDSWNKWDEDMQLEPAQSYGESYLDMTKKQFKKQ